ncbi:hypothetical protein WME79_33790 [Sorangium sp. So ce726]|uniref:tetratricopeptide repeat protein n=1 Tax=Sorangium sp. So ce726 TaxID=3133319 RepID=UPI003F63EAEA
MLLSGILVAFCAASARAETPRPRWSEGIPADRMERAQALFQEARELHRALMLGEARAKYEEALSYWENPELRLYLARVLMRTGKPLLAYENLQKALWWGPGSIDPAYEEEARTAMRELEQRELSAIRIRCHEPGAAVMLDGKPWFVGPGSRRQIVIPGEHIVTAKKTGYYRVAKPVVVLAGKEAAGTIELSFDKIVTERQWPVWLPWGVAGAGVALGLLGAGLEWQATVLHDEARQRFERACDWVCTPQSADKYDRGVMESRIAIGLIVVGGAALVSGSAMEAMNVPRSYRTEDRGGMKVGLVPVVSGSAAALLTRISF